MMDTFTFIGYDEGGMNVGRDGAHRLVCVARSGAKVAIFGSEGNLKNMNAVLDAGLPCFVRCRTRTPATHAAERFGHTHWVSEDSALETPPADSSRFR